MSDVASADLDFFYYGGKKEKKQYGIAGRFFLHPKYFLERKYSV